MARYACIKAIATYLPPTIESNAEEDVRFIRKIGVSERHIASDSESAGDLAVEAAEKLFCEYQIPRTKIEFIILCVQTPDYLLPTTACIVQSRLEIPKSCGAVDYNLGCSGYVYGLSMAKGMIEAGMVSNVLLLTTSVYTKYVNPKDRTIRPLFGDGATATFLEAEAAGHPLMGAFVFGSDGSLFDRLIIPAGGSRNMPQNTPEIAETDSDGNYRSNYNLYMDGVAVTYFTLREVPALVDQVLGKANLERKDVDYYVFHQASSFMLEYVQKKCRLTGLPFYNDIRETGNTVAGTIPFALEKVLKEKAEKSLERVMLAGFGVGLSWAGCIVDLGRVMSRET